jgi:hypothetical protein
VSDNPALAFYKKKLHQLNRQLSGTCSKRPPTTSVSTVVVPPDSLPPTPSTLAATKTPENR